MIGNVITNCETTINQRNSLQTQALADQLKVYFNGEALVVEGMPFDQNFAAELIATDGKILRQGNFSGANPILFRGALPPSSTGMYLLRLYDENISVTKKVIR